MCISCTSYLSLSPVHYMSQSSMISFFPSVAPIPLSFCLQPSRRPFLQPTFSLDCPSAPSPHHHCHQNERFASQLSLCLVNPHASSLCTSSYLPTLSLYSSSLQFPHHISSPPSPQAQPPPIQNTSYYYYSFSQYNATLNPKSKANPSMSLQTQTSSLCNGSCPNKTNPPSSIHLLCSSQPTSNNSFSHLCTSNVCPQTLPDIQLKSNPNPKTLQLTNFHSDCQTNPSTPLQPDSDPHTQHPAVQSCGRPPVAPSPLTLLHTEYRPSACTLSVTNAQPASRIPNLPVTTHTAFPITCSEGPTSRLLKAGGVLLSCTKAVFKNKPVCLCEKCCSILVCGAISKYSGDN